MKIDYSTKIMRNPFHLCHRKYNHVRQKLDLNHALQGGGQPIIIHAEMFLRASVASSVNEKASWQRK
ncbi:MAG: hypothetical protein R3A44_03830 [Caldilineaceae bacterium]